MIETINKRYLAIFEQSALAIQIYSRDGFTIAVNDAWENLFETSKRELENYNVLQDPQIHQNGVIKWFERAFAGEVVNAPAAFYDPCLSGKIGRARWLESIYSPVKNEAGEVIEVAIIFLDVTEKKKTDQALAESRDQLKVIFENIAEGVLVLDINFKCIYANPEAARMAGMSSAEEWMNNDALVSYHEYLTEEGEPFPYDQLPSRRAFAGELAPPATNIRFRNKITGEDKTSNVIARPILNAEGKPYLVVTVFRDITEQRRREKNQLQTLNEQDRALAVKDLFFSVASHELRTPITSLKLQLQILDVQYPSSGGKEILTKVNRQIDKLAKLVEDMLDISRISLGKLELRLTPTNLGNLVQEIFDRLKLHLELAEIPYHLSLATDVNGSWDPDRLEQVIENLVLNAMKYAKSPIHVSVSRDSENAYLEIRDFGPGIPIEDHQKIFQRFQRSTTSKDLNGFGLGLYIVREIVNLHGGEIHVENSVAGGAVFKVSLPIQV